MEALNCRYNIEGTLRKRSEFGQLALDISSWIRQRSVNDVGCPYQVTLSVSTWRLAYDAIDSAFIYVARKDILRNHSRPAFSTTTDERSHTRSLIPSLKLIYGLTSSSVEGKIREVLHATMRLVKVKEDPSRATDFNFLTNMMSNFYMLQPLGEGRRGDYILFSCTCRE